jgi:Protein of unknown function (DUF998)
VLGRADELSGPAHAAGRPAPAEAAEPANDGRPGHVSAASQRATHRSTPERECLSGAVPDTPEGHSGARGLTGRAISAWVLGIAGVIAYNWWLLVPLKPGLMTSPDELFSNLEVTGQPYASLMQHADLASGVLLLAAFVVTGPAGRTGRREWLAMLAFTTSGALGGLFPEVCADGISATCRALEWHFELPATQYIHLVAGVVEFAAITIALLYARRRTRRSNTRSARVYRALRRAALVGYPLLGAAYLSDRLGGIMEALFFTGFTAIVVTQLAERAAALYGRQRPS